jgi:hypothetical protein
MKSETFKGTIESAYGNPLPEALKFSGAFDAYETYEEVAAANDLPKNSEILDFVNNKRKANARQKSMQEVLTAAGINKPTLEDPQFQLKSMIKILVTAGRSEAEATQLAEATLGVKLV